jgi:hypothetical protein
LNNTLLDLAQYPWNTKSTSARFSTPGGAITRYRYTCAKTNPGEASGRCLPARGGVTSHGSLTTSTGSAGDGFIIMKPVRDRSCRATTRENLPTKAQPRKALLQSGRDVEAFFAKILHGEPSLRLFGTQAVRWMYCLIAHESHHRRRGLRQ